MDRKEKLQQLLRLRPAARPETARPLAPAPSSGGAVPPEVECRESVLDLSGCHGNVPMDAASPITPQLFHLAGLPLDQWSEGLRLVFLDAETTGLAGGTGTYIFLMGLGFLDPGRPGLALRQYFLPDPGAEEAFLRQVRAELAAGDLLICFNGKSYDLPLLQTRLRMNGLEPLPAAQPVLDLLFPARRYWKPLLGSCTLQNLEREAIGFHRLGDLPGALVPEMYFRYLRGAGRASLEPVFEHNRLDLIGMGALLALLNRIMSLDDSLDPHALDCLLRCLLARGRIEEFRRLYRRHAARWDEEARRHAGLGRTLARLCKKAGFRAESYDLFTHLSRHRPRQAPESLEEVLIYEEHVLKDARTALRHCDKFMGLVESWRDRADLAQRLEYRRRRLSGKV
jgi:uncharacterized protein YprB with RNaseH-like and TPR domain